MSSAPKGERIANDAYFTPDDVAARCVATLFWPGVSKILEPSVGGGAFVRALRNAAPHARITGIDINPDAPGLALCDGAASADLIDWPLTYDAVVGNPPYNHAEAHIRHALTLAPRCAFLLRLAFLESTKRVPFWRDHKPARVYVLAQRPSFAGGGTDSAAYGWFVWDADHKGPTVLDVLDESGPLWGAR